MWLRLTQKGDIAFLDRVILNYRHHESNMSNDMQRMARGKVYVRGKLLSTTGLDPEQRRIVLIANWWWGRLVCLQRLRLVSQHLCQGRLAYAIHEVSRMVAIFARCAFGLPVWDDTRVVRMK